MTPNKLKDIKLIVIDIDGTLVDLRRRQLHVPVRRVAVAGAPGTVDHSA